MLLSRVRELWLGSLGLPRSGGSACLQPGEAVGCWQAEFLTLHGLTQGLSLRGWMLVSPCMELAIHVSPSPSQSLCAAPLLPRDSHRCRNSKGHQGCGSGHHCKTASRRLLCLPRVCPCITASCVNVCMCFCIVCARVCMFLHRVCTYARAFLCHVCTRLLLCHTLPVFSWMIAGKHTEAPSPTLAHFTSCPDTPP